MSSKINNKFWDLVKLLVLKNKSDLKPCKFYEANKQLVDKKFNVIVEKEKKKR